MSFIGWFSCGITSAIACKLLLKKYENVEFYYTDTGSQDDDSIRFLKDCENWYGKKITILRNEKYSNHFDVIEKNRMRQGRFYSEPSEINDERNVANSNRKGFQGKKSAQQPERFEQGIQYWRNFPTQSPVCNRNDGIPGGLDGITFSKWRNEAIKAMGNSVVPQVVFQIFRAIEKVEHIKNQ